MATEKPMSATHVVNFITGNKNKLGEVKAILEPTIEVRSQALDLIEVQGTLEEVTIAKCKSAAEQVHPLIPQEIHMHVCPGKNRATDAKPPNPDRRPRAGGGYLPLLRRAEGPSGTIYVCSHTFPAFLLPTEREKGKNHVELSRLTLSRSKWFMKDLGHEGLNNLLVAYEDKGAKAVCTFGFSQGPGHEPILFQGITQGKIVPARGPANFGWDPIFEYEGQT